MSAHEHLRPSPDPATDRLEWIERRGDDDFPYYNGSPVGLSAGRWIAVGAACLVAFLVLSLVPTPDDVVALVPRTLFTAIMLAVLMWAAGPQWRAMFRRVGFRDVGLMVLFAALNYATTLIVALVVASVFSTSSHATIGAPSADVPDRVALYLGTAIQLLGEELLTILPLLTLLHVLSARTRLSRRAAVLLAWLSTAVWFGLLHLPTYDWHLAQALLIIGVARLVLTLAYIRTKNLWVSTGAHVLNDWALISSTSVTATLIA